MYYIKNEFYGHLCYSYLRKTLQYLINWHLARDCIIHYYEKLDKERSNGKCFNNICREINSAVLLKKVVEDMIIVCGDYAHHPSKYEQQFDAPSKYPTKENFCHFFSRIRFYSFLPWLCLS